MSRTLTGAWIETDLYALYAKAWKSHPHGCVD